MSETRVLRSVPSVHFAVQPREQPRPLPMELSAYTAQVAGHRDHAHGKYTGLLQCPNGTILKPILKESQRREIEFYERLRVTEDPDLIELRSFVPKYFGTKKVTYNGYEQEYIVLEDLTKGMLLPCIMDVKIGKITWDPLASEQKILNEKRKYRECKQQYSFCIPGYQVAQLSTGRLYKYGKQHGKNLQGTQVVDALRSFVWRGGCRCVLVCILSWLWRVQRLLRVSRRLQLYSASLLLLYDAAAVPPYCPHHRTRKYRQDLSRSHSFHSLYSLEAKYRRQFSSLEPNLKESDTSPSNHSATIKSSWTDALDRLTNNHSFKNNYERKIHKIKLDYHTTLDRLSSDTIANNNPVGTVKIIDFAHAFFNEETEQKIDSNFKEGIDSLVNIFEMLLKETDDNQSC